MIYTDFDFQFGKREIEMVNDDVQNSRYGIPARQDDEAVQAGATKRTGAKCRGSEGK
jgi:hypothetical protein